MSDLRASGQYATVNGADRKVISRKDGRLQLADPTDPRRYAEVVRFGDCERIYNIETRATWRSWRLEVHEVRDGKVLFSTTDPRVVEGVESDGDARNGYLFFAPVSELTDITETVVKTEVGQA